MPGISQPAPNAPPAPAVITKIDVTSAKPTKEVATPPATPAPDAAKATPPSPAAPDASKAAPAANVQPPTTPAAPPKPDPAAAGLAELARKESAFRNEKKKTDDEIKAWQAEKAERTANEAKWKEDPIALLEAHGHGIDAVIDFAASGGASSADAKIRALETKIERDAKAARDAKEKEAKDAEAAATAQRQAAARGFLRGEVGKLVKEDRFELCGKAAERGGNLAAEVEMRIRRAWDGVPAVDEHGNQTGEMTGGGVDMTIEQALEAIENELDTYGLSLASSKKLKAKLAPAPTDGKKPSETNQQPPRQSDDQAPTATTRRAITIKNRTQAVAPIRTKARADDRLPPGEVTRKVADNFARMFQKQ